MNIAKFRIICRAFALSDLWCRNPAERVSQQLAVSKQMNLYMAHQKKQSATSASQF